MTQNLGCNITTFKPFRGMTNNRIRSMTLHEDKGWILEYKNYQNRKVILKEKVIP
jgi:hypothetical protein